MNKTDNEIRQLTDKHGKNAARLFDEAKKIQQGSCRLPMSERQKIMNEVVAMEKEAVFEFHKSDWFEYI